MSNRFFKLIPLFGAATLLGVSCKKESQKTTSCTTSVHAYLLQRPSISTMTGTVGSLNTGLSMFTGISSPITGDFTFVNGAYNSSDSCYYLFRGGSSGSSSSTDLCKVDRTGTITTYTGSSSYYGRQLVYDRFTHQLYTLESGSIKQVSISGSTYSLSTVFTPSHLVRSGGYEFSNSLTVDRATGDLYTITGDTANCYIEKFTRSSGSGSIVATFSSTSYKWHYSLCYNTADNKLYSLKETWAPLAYKIIKTDPASGSSTELTTFDTTGTIFNPDFHSACIDECSNKYVLSTVMSTNYLIKFDLSSSSFTIDTTHPNILGLSAE